MRRKKNREFIENKLSFLRQEGIEMALQKIREFREFKAKKRCGIYLVPRF